MDEAAPPLEGSGLKAEESRSDSPEISAPPPKPDVAARPTPEELVARAIAPVKTEYLRPPPQRLRSVPDGGGNVDDNAAEKKGVASAIVKEKKSKRQLKRERKQEQKSVLHICPEIAKSGKSDACRYGSSCRFSHDLEAFLTQRPADLEGSCPFLGVANSCPYGVTCRFLNTHRAADSSEAQNLPDKSYESNTLNKDLQKLLWKNKLKFPKATAQLKLLGIAGGNKTKATSGWLDQPKNNSDSANGANNNPESSCTEFPCIAVNEKECESLMCLGNDNLNDASIVDDSRPSKKAKSPEYEQQFTEIENGLCHMEKDIGELHVQNGSEENSIIKLCSSENDLYLKPHAREKKLVDFRGKLYLAPLTTVGNLPFRRTCKVFGADITCGEMAMSTNLLQGQASEWALLRRHSSEDVFGIQICGAYPDTIARTVELIDQECRVDFIDINMGCPIDIVVNKGAGSSLLTKPMRMKNIIQSASGTVDKPITVKVRTGYLEGRNRIDSLVSDISSWGASALTIHGRSRQQRYSKLADWDYIYHCTRVTPDVTQVLGNGDIFSFSDWNTHISDCPELSTCMIARGALIKPWIFTEIKEQRDWDISSGERFNILKDFVNFGLEHWGSDTKGLETTRYFLLEWLSYTYRYVPVGLLDVVPQRLNWRPPSYYGRDDLETLMASDSAADWIRISEMLLGKVPDGFTFTPKHKSNAYDRAENG